MWLASAVFQGIRERRESKVYGSTRAARVAIHGGRWFDFIVVLQQKLRLTFIALPMSHAP
jgi:hypothetical protein